MLTGKDFWVGVFVGVVGVWAYHAFLKPLPGKTAGA